MGRSQILLFFFLTLSSIIVKPNQSLNHSNCFDPHNYFLKEERNSKLVPRLVIVPIGITTIQAAIDSVQSGDTILVEPGTYTESINFNGKNVTMGSRFMTTGDTSYISKTILLTTQLKPVVTIEKGEDSTALLCGFTLLGYPVSIDGKGIYIKQASPTLKNLIIKTNKRSLDLTKTLLYGGSGGGIYFQQSNSIIFNVYISDCFAEYGAGIYAAGSNLQFDSLVLFKNTVHGGGYANTGSGGGIESYGSNLKLTNSIIANNAGTGYEIDGLGICSRQSLIQLINVTIANNKPINPNDSNYSTHGGALYFNDDSKIEVVNSILWNNLPEEIYFSANDDSSWLVVSNSNVKYGKDSIVSNSSNKIFWLKGNLSVDPLFADTTAGNYQLSEGSACIDAGVQNTYLLYNNNNDTIFIPKLNYSGIAPDMGSHEYKIPSGIRQHTIIPNCSNLSQNYPNPFNPETIINYQLPVSGFVTLKVYDVLGNEVATLVNEEKQPGNYEVNFNTQQTTNSAFGGKQLSSGVYFYQLRSSFGGGNFVQTKKMIVLK